MSRLSWRDTASPNFGSSVSDVVRANKLLQDSIGGISTGLGNFSAANKASQAEALAKQQEAAQSQLLAGVLQRAGEGRSTQDWIQQAGSEYAANPSMYNPTNVEGILKHLNTAATDNTTLVNLDETERKNTQNTEWDNAAKQYQNVQAEALLRQQMGDVAGSEQLQRDNVGLLAKLKLGDQRDVVSGSDSTRQNKTGDVVARDGNARSWITSNQGTEVHNQNRALFEQGQARYQENENARSLASYAAMTFANPVDAANFIVKNARTPAEAQTALQQLDNQVTGKRVSQMFRSETPTSGQGSSGSGNTGSTGGTDTNFTNIDLKRPTVEGTAANNTEIALKRATDQEQGSTQMNLYIEAGSSKKGEEEVIAGIAERTGGSTSDIGRAFEIIKKETSGTLSPEQVRIIYEDSIINLTGGQQLYNSLNRIVPFTHDVIDIGTSSLFGAIPSDRVTTRKSLLDSISKYDGPNVARSTEKSQRQANLKQELTDAKKLSEDARYWEEADRLNALITGAAVDPKIVSGREIADQNLGGIAMNMGNNSEATPMVQNPIDRGGAYISTPEANKVIKEQEKAQEAYQEQESLIRRMGNEIKESNQEARIEEANLDIRKDLQSINEWEKFQSAFEEERQRDLSKIESQRLNQYKQQIKDSRVELMKARLALAKTTEGVGSDFRKRMKALDTINRMEKKIPELMFKVEELSE